MSSNLWQVARDRGNQIARELKLRKACEVVHPDQRRRFDRVLAELGETPNEPARRRLEDLYRGAGRRREVQTAVALLDQAWRIPPGSRLEEDVTLLLRRCYLEARRQSAKDRIRDELRDRQWSAFPNVRRVVHLVRQLDEADAAEIVELQHLDRGYPDLRASIAERVILHGQVAYLAETIRFLATAIEDEELITQDRREVNRVFATLRTQLRRSPDALRVLFDEYLYFYDRPEPRGHLQYALANYGDELVPLLVHVHSEDLATRPAIEHLLQRMIGDGYPAAAEALADIVKTARPADLARVCRYFGKGIETYAASQRDSGGAIEAIAENTVAAIERLPQKEARDLADQLRRQEWGDASIQDVVDRLVAGQTTESDLQRVRRTTRQILPLLLPIVRDLARPVEERVRVLSAFNRLRSASKRPLAAHLWEVFSCSPEVEVKIAVVHALSALELDPGPEAREAFYKLLDAGPLPLRVAIDDHWKRIFAERGLDADGLTPRAR